MVGGLASLPATCFNSPIFPIESASTLQKGNLSPLRYVIPSHLHNTTEFFGDDLECHKRDDFMGQQGGFQFHLTAAPPTSDLSDDDEDDDDSTMFNKSWEPSLHPQKDDFAMVDIQSRQPSPHIPEDDGPVVVIESRELLNNPQEDDACKSMELLLNPQEDDSTMVGIQSRQLSLHLQEDDSTMVGIQSRQPSRHLQEDDASMVGVESREVLSGTDKDDEDGRPMNEVESSDSLNNLNGKLKEDSMVVVESKEPVTESEKVNEGQSANGVGIVEATPANGVESEEMSLGFESSVTATSQPRRSSRNISYKKKRMANFMAAHKSSSGKRKLPFEKEDIPLQASLQTFPSNKSE